MAKPPIRDAESVGTWTDSNGMRWRYALTWEPVDGRIECTRLELAALDGQPVTSSALRAFPIGAFLARGRRKQRDLALWVADAVPGRRAEALAQATAWSAARDGQPGPKGYAPKHYVKVAEVYRREALVGGRPRLAVAEHFTVTPSAAAKWIAKARAMGLLPPGRKGKAG